MTGAPLPDGADSVVQVEDTEPGDAVVILEGAPAGTSVRRAGGDIAAGSTVVAAGTRLGANHLGVLASIGAALPLVYRRPIVAVLSTGDELVGTGPRSSSLARFAAPTASSWSAC